MSDESLYQIAIGAIEQYLGDVCDEHPSEDAIYDEAYTIAFDALHHLGIDVIMAGKIASQAAQNIAQQ